jgi:hypothetical protein
LRGRPRLSHCVKDQIEAPVMAVPDDQKSNLR